MTAKILHRLISGAFFVVLMCLLAAGESMASQWQEDFSKIDQSLRAKQWEPAEKGARKLAARIADDGGAGGTRDDFRYNLAAATAMRAIAEAGMGRSDDAAWHWDMALNLHPDIAKMDFTPYGPAAAGLQGRQLRAVDASGGPTRLDAASRPEIQPARVSKERFPVFAKSIWGHRFAVVEVIVGTDGQPRKPILLPSQKDGGPAMAYAVLEAVRQWRFKPARLEGKPLEVPYVVTVHHQDQPAQTIPADPLVTGPAGPPIETREPPR